MTVQECYDRMGADYEGVMHRLVTEERVKKFIIKLPEDESFLHLCTAMEHQDADDAFMWAHTLKGIAMNFGLTGLIENAGTMTEELRGGTITPKAIEAFEKVKVSYPETIALIGMLSEEGGLHGEQ